MKKKDNRLIAALSVWGILLVVLGHSGFTEPYILEHYRYLHKWIYAFHMPLFFWISGYLFSYTTPRFDSIDLGQLLLKKTKRLLLPYLVIGAIVLSIKILFAQWASVERTFSLGLCLRMFICPSADFSALGYLWFLPTLFMLFLITGILCKLGINLKKIGNTLLICCFSWILYCLLPPINLFNLSNAMWYLPFFLIGIAYHVKQQYVDEKLRINRLWFMVLMGGGGYAKRIF